MLSALSHPCARHESSPLDAPACTGVLPKGAETAPEPIAEQEDDEASWCTDFERRRRGLWAAVLFPGKLLVVTIPKGLTLSLLRASLPPEAGMAIGHARKPNAAVPRPALRTAAVRCRVPSSRAVTTLASLDLVAASLPLSTVFTENDRKCAIGVEGVRARRIAKDAPKTLHAYVCSHARAHVTAYTRVRMPIPAHARTQLHLTRTPRATLATTNMPAFLRTCISRAVGVDARTRT
eukprot:6181172-Pleurochrysis_carterae.AAC.2